jgi:uncharacterized membrane protein YbhN (UPF0104 family)
MSASLNESSPRAKSSWSTRLRLAGTVLSLLLLAWLLWKQDWGTLVASAVGIPAGRLLLAFVLILVCQLWNSARWLALLNGQDIRPGYLRTMQIAFAGLFASNFLPTTIGGDVVRVVGVAKVTRDRVVGAATVVMDRAVSVFGMLFVLPFSWPLVHGLLSVGPWLNASLALADRRLIRRVARWSARAKDALAIWARRPLFVGLALLASWVGVACYLGAVWLVAGGLGIPVSLGDVAGATALTYFLTLLPISINGYGLREVGMLALYVQLGATAEQASALALITRAMLMIVSLPGALWLSNVAGAAAPSAGEGGSREG